MKRLTLLALLVVSLCTLSAATPATSASLSSATGGSYWCPSYTWYCQRNSQCRGYCGAGVPAEWEVCSQGCCACAG
ncbi:MAG TPA: hypothetical protein VKK31_31840 [Thermoanaerobaculia bacterium]|nr:hypothetical protein [Thermoanaerobaculia bacterium]